MSAANWVSPMTRFTRGARNTAKFPLFDLKHMRQLEEENLRLKRLVADLSLDKAMLQDVLAKRADAGTSA